MSQINDSHQSASHDCPRGIGVSGRTPSPRDDPSRQSNLAPNTKGGPPIPERRAICARRLTVEVVVTLRPLGPVLLSCPSACRSEPGSGRAAPVSGPGPTRVRPAGQAGRLTPGAGTSPVPRLPIIFEALKLTRRISLMWRILVALAARILRVSRILRGNGTLTHYRGLRDDGRRGHLRPRHHIRPFGTPIP
jgi:hypothetical protein